MRLGTFFHISNPDMKTAVNHLLDAFDIPLTEKNDAYFHVTITDVKEKYACMIALVDPHLTVHNILHDTLDDVLLHVQTFVKMKEEILNKNMLFAEIRSLRIKQETFPAMDELKLFEYIDFLESQVFKVSPTK